MRYSAYALLATAKWASALTQDCTGTAVDEGGNWFCGAVDHILYEGIVGKGSYKAVTGMSDSGVCGTANKAYSGPLAPLDEDLSIHVRGPAQLKEAAVYYLGSDNKKRGTAPSPHVHARRHGHGHGHQHLHKEKRADMVVATIDGKIVSWENNYFGPSTAAPAAPAPTTTTAEAPAAKAPADQPPADPTTKAPAAKTTETSDSSDSSSDGTTSTGGAWDRVAYYDAESQVADNMVFLGNYGGQGSGVWDTTWGGSLSYLSADGTAGSGSSNTLKNTLIPSNKEFAIFSAEKCDDSCGFSRATDVAYKGFSGANKVFLFNFKMPMDGNRGFNGDMPALWLLNGRVPRTQQYGDCSCWGTSCGEADIYEVLASGDTKCKSTFHLAAGEEGGSSDYFDRPVDNYVKVAVVFNEKTSSVSIKQLADSVDFSEGLDDATVQSWSSGGSNGATSLFQVSR